MSDPKQHLISTALLAAVPLWFIELRLPETFDSLIEESQKFSSELASKGDVLLFGGNKKGETAAMFTKLAKAIVVLSCAPGGITLFGYTWQNGKPTPVKNKKPGTPGSQRKPTPL